MPDSLLIAILAANWYSSARIWHATECAEII